MYLLTWLIVNKDYRFANGLPCGRLWKRASSTVAGLAQSVECLTAEREVAGSIPRAGPLLRVLK